MRGAPAATLVKKPVREPPQRSAVSRVQTRRFQPLPGQAHQRVADSTTNSTRLQRNLAAVQSDAWNLARTPACCQCDFYRRFRGFCAQRAVKTARGKD